MPLGGFSSSQVSKWVMRSHHYLECASEEATPLMYLSSSGLMVGKGEGIEKLCVLCPGIWYPGAGSGTVPLSQGISFQ